MFSQTKLLVLLRLADIIRIFSAFSVWYYKKTTQCGVVTGILYSMDDAFGKSTALIDDHIVSEGDAICDVNVVKIERSTVEFERNGESWKQRVREKPNPAWTKSVEH